MNDLIGVIATYATPQVTFNLLTIDPGQAVLAYRSYIWKQKALWESRGLIVDEKLIEVSGWYAYYLMRNRTFYGHIVLAKSCCEPEEYRDQVAINLERELYSGYKFWYQSPTGELVLVRPDLTRIKYRTPHRFQHLEFYGNWIGLTERGQVVRFSPRSTSCELCFESLVDFDNIVAFFGSKNFLDRSGKILTRDGSVIGAEVKTVELIWSVDALLADGSRRLSRQAGRIRKGEVAPGISPDLAPDHDYSPNGVERRDHPIAIGPKQTVMVIVEKAVAF